MENNNKFFKVLEFVDQVIYKPNHLNMSFAHEEKQNEKYGAGTFLLSSKTVRFRVVNTTPNKVGQFVAFWVKDKNNNTQAFHFDSAPDLLVINCIGKSGKLGQFVFPKEVLLKYNILRSHKSEGKMGIRVYPLFGINQKVLQH